jgi:hypothetical protein
MRESILKKVFLMKEKSHSLSSWSWLLLLEVYLGEQLLEMLGNTASYDEDVLGKTNGLEGNLIDFIPATFFNKVLSKSIVKLLNDKYTKHYQLIVAVQSAKDSKTLFKLNNKNLHLLTELKLTYNTIWVSLNLTIDIVVYIITNDISVALATGAVIEFIRRFKL